MFSRSFFGFFAAQALGAFNDNLYRNAIVLLATFVATHSHGASIAALSAGVFVLPFFLLSATAGTLADRMDKAALVQWLKLSEVVIMVLAAAGFYFMHQGFLLLVLFLMGAQSALFGPVKYAILPQLVAAEKLLLANALIEAATFFVILLGMIVSSALMFSADGRLWVSGTCVAIAIAGALASRFIAPLPATSNTTPLRLRPWHDMKATLKDAAIHTAQRARMMGVAWFWALGSVFVTLIPAFCNMLPGEAQNHIIWLLGAFATGIGVGSLLCARLAHGTPRLRDVTAGSIAVAVAISVLSALSMSGLAPPAWQHSAYAACLFIAAVGGGFFVVPLYTQLQRHAPATLRGRTIAASNICNALAMCVASLINSAALWAGLPLTILFALWAIATPLVRWMLPLKE